MPFQSVRAYFLYAAAWLPYGASYFLIFFSQNNGGPVAFLHALLNILPAAILGLFVISFAQRITWTRETRFIVISQHALLSLLYSCLWWGIVVILVSLFFSALAHHWVFSPWGVYAVQWQLFSGLMVYANLTGFTYLVSAQKRAADEKQRRLEAEALRTQSDLNALRSQLNPHFLFNTLNSVLSLVATDPAKAETALLTLSEILRYALSSHSGARQDEVSLREELRFTNGYLALEALRLGKRLRIEQLIHPSALDLELPALTLQPLVENAIKHGIAPNPLGGRLTLHASRRAGALAIQISDDGAGADPAAALANSSGMGLRVIRRRLELFYRGAATMEIQSQPGRGFRVTLHLPQQNRHSAVA